MKKVLSLLTGLFVVFVIAGSASAVSFTEEYTGAGQIVNAGESFNFDFDFKGANFYSGASTDSSLSLTTDAYGAGSPFSSASLNIQLYAEALPLNTAEIQFNMFYTQPFNLAVTGSWDVGFYGGYFLDYTYDLNSSQLSDFAAHSGFSKVEISAVGTGGGFYTASDFAIMKVGMQVNTAPVPEPATMLLFSIGLLGLAGVNRKKQ